MLTKTLVGIGKYRFCAVKNRPPGRHFPPQRPPDGSPDRANSICFFWLAQPAIPVRLPTAAFDKNQSFTLTGVIDFQTKSHLIGPLLFHQKSINHEKAVKIRSCGHVCKRCDQPASQTSGSIDFHTRWLKKKSTNHECCDWCFCIV